MKLSDKIQVKDIILILLIAGISVYGPCLSPNGYRSIIQFGIVVILVSALYLRWKTLSIKSLGLLDQYSKDKIEQEKMLHTQEVMLELSNSMIQVEGFEELLNIILLKAIDVVQKAEYGSVLIMNEENQLEFKALYGLSEELYDIRLKPEESYQWLATGGKFEEPVIIEDLQKYSEDFIDEQTHQSMKDADAINMKSTLSAPILLEGRFFGSINIDSEKVGTFGEEDIKLMAYFANQASVAIEHHRLYESMHYLSKYDGLTGTLNRYRFEEAVDALIDEASKASKTVSVALIDLNAFKRINDNYGHAVGDMVLSQFAQNMKAALTDSGYLARFGGDEFSIAFENCNHEEALNRVSHLLKVVSEMPVSLGELNKNLHCTFSYGVASYPAEGDTLKQLLRVADMRMYDQKNKLKKM